KDAEKKAAYSAKERGRLTFARWAKRLQRYYSHVELLFSPDLIIVGGGVSKNHNEFLPLLDLRAPIVPAALRNNAGILGAAALAVRQP
ncbi:MAG TPA: ROK family protein, partial [Glaciihabitans sp.]|nr:ROK family protein [Glaciihabitans sp.]